MSEKNKAQEVNAKKIVAYLNKFEQADAKSISESLGIAVIQVHGIGKKLRDAGQIDYDYNSKLYSIKSNGKKLVVDIVAEVAETVEPEVAETVEAEVAETVEPETEKNARDFSKTTFRGVSMRKGKLAHALIQAYVESNDVDLSTLMDAFPRNLVRGGGIIEKLETARKINLKGRQRWFTDRTMHIKLSDGNVVCVSNQISKHNIGGIIDAAALVGILID